MSATQLPPERLRVFFSITALLHAAAIVSAFPVLEARLPSWLPATILWAHFPILFLGGYLQGRAASGSSGGQPSWMQIEGRARLSFALAVSYLFIIVLKTYEISLGPVDPLQAPSAALYGRASWYAIWSLGASGLLAMGPAATLVSALRLLTAPARRLPPVLGVTLSLLMGLAVGYGALRLVASAAVRASVGSLYALTPELMAGIGGALACCSLLYSLASRE